ncbi:MAG: ribosome silencing factor [Candidatus Margulisiibacteriota bacterium]
MKSQKRALTNKTLPSARLASIIAKGAQEKQAQDIEILDIRKTSSVCNYLVLCTANSSPHIGAITDGIDEVLIKSGIKPAGWQGKNDSNWKILDIISIVVHVMGGEERNKYGLEKLWEKSGVTYHV